MKRVFVLTGLAASLIVTERWCVAGSADVGNPHSPFPDDSVMQASDSIPQGIARPYQRATMSAPLPGMLVEVTVKPGDQVKSGEILAVLDNRVASAAVDAARAAANRTGEIEHAKHALSLARSFLARQAALQEARAGADFELEQARTRRDQAEAELASALESQVQARRNLELEEARLEAHNIRAPFHGQVIRLQTTVGTMLEPSDDVLTIASLDFLEAELHVSLELFGELVVGRSYRLWAFAPVNGPVQAELTHTSPLIDSASDTFRCLFTVDNRDRHLPAGFGVRFHSPRPHSSTEGQP